MKRKVYTTRRERMTDQIVGFLAFPLVNVPLGFFLWIISQIAYSWLLSILFSALPWLVNGILILLALLWRPEIAIGYVTFMGAAVAMIILMSVLFVAACFVTIISSTVIRDRVEWVFICSMAAGLLCIIGLAIYLFTIWWSSYKNNSQ